MGQSIKSIIRVVDDEGRTVKNAQVALSIRDPEHKVIASLPAIFGSGDVYRTNTWTIPHRLQEGSWTIVANAVEGTLQGTAATTFTVNNSTSEKLLYKYGFWIDASGPGQLPDLGVAQLRLRAGQLTHDRG